MAKELPTRTADFIRRYIGSLEQLEILLFLSAAPELPRTVDDVYQEIRSNPQSIARRLEQMVSLGLLELVRENPKTYRYQPGTPELAEAVKELDGIYRQHRVAVIEHIFAEPPSPIQGFADSFRIRKSESNG